MMFRLLLSLIAVLALTACQTETPPVVDWKEDALKRGAEKVAACKASECTRLDLDGTHLADFTVLNDMPHVTKLMMSRTNFTDLADIADMTQLTELHISWTDVSDLSGVAAFRNLQMLHANDLYQQPTYAPVYRMTALKELSLDARPDDGLSFVRNMGRLESLFFMSGEITDLSPLAGNRSIKNLALEAALPDDVAPLLQMRGLQTLDVNSFAVDEDTKARIEDRGVTVQYFPAMIVC
ncbi:hypothetical protein SAMN04488515_0144 [Cognatiyoonia koreensis]|uniref:Leucine Rich repeat-containing protein n=1 Tax=Cognatiyoonia koreensis TaxID=364200 RepID=A0A1I0MPU1_9RHOB|nr:hypothetical protein [Cognatiyoonia koreensis]SEV90167.1 hypothetical protein SAMN04488515_0144 [Cognatiyoonia koreensis]